MKNTYEKFIFKRTNQITTSDHPLLLRQQSTHSINKHYKEFQHALYALKLAVEDLWRLELQQLDSHQPTSSNTKFDLQVPSIYSCRTILPMISEKLDSKNDLSARVNAPIILQPTPKGSIHKMISKETRTSNEMIRLVPHAYKSIGTFHSKSNKQRQYGSGDNSIKYCQKTALLHLKFRCPKHTH